MPFLINLTTDERIAMPKMDDNRRPFVEKALYYAGSESNIRPPYLDLEEIKKDLKLFADLQRINRELGRLDESIRDTLIAVGSDGYVAALTIYNAAKMAQRANVPGIDHIVNDLKRQFYQEKPKETEEQG